MILQYSNAKTYVVFSVDPPDQLQLYNHAPQPHSHIEVAVATRRPHRRQGKQAQKRKVEHLEEGGKGGNYNVIIVIYEQMCGKNIVKMHILDMYCSILCIFMLRGQTPIIQIL